MYREFFGFQSDPFNLTPDSRFLFLSKRHEEALAALEFGVQNRKGFIAITGEIGSGKTTLCRAFLGRLDHERNRVALILNPDLSDVELLQSVCAEFEQPDATTSKRTLLDTLNRFLLEQLGAGRNCILIIDEAQNLPARTLEMVRMISNLETETEKLIQIVLVGQPELDTILHKREFEQLNQRVTVRYHLLALDADDVGRYVAHRIQVAAPKEPVRFEPSAVLMLAAHTKGVPRRINVICDRALLIAYVEESRTVRMEHIRRAIDEVAGSRPAAVAAGRGGDGRDGNYEKNGSDGIDDSHTSHDSHSSHNSHGAASPASRSPGASARAGRRVAGFALLALGILAALAVAPRWFRGAASDKSDGPDRSDVSKRPAVAATPPPLASPSPLPTPTPWPSPTQPPTPTPYPTATAPPSPSPSVSPTASASPSASVSPSPSATAGAAATAAPSPSPSATVAPTPTSAPAPTPIARWTIDGSGVVRIDLDGLSRVASVVTWLRLNGKDIDMAELDAMPLEQAQRLQLASGAPPLYLREVELPADVERLAAWNRPCLVRLRPGGHGLSTWGIMAGGSAGQITWLDPRVGKVIIPAAGVRAEIQTATGLYMDPDDLASLHLGVEGPRVKALRELLLANGALRPEDAATVNVFNRTMSLAIAVFQTRSNIPATARMDPLTAWLLVGESAAAKKPEGIP